MTYNTEVWIDQHAVRLLKSLEFLNFLCLWQIPAQIFVKQIQHFSFSFTPKSKELVFFTFFVVWKKENQLELS